MNLEDKVQVNGRGNVMKKKKLAPRRINLKTQHMQRSVQDELTNELVTSGPTEMEEFVPADRRSKREK